MADNPHREDNYLQDYIYQENLPQEDGFARFEYEGEWYFAFYIEEEMILRSEGYSSEAARDNGIQSVKKHMGDNANYHVRMQPDGKWVLELRAANKKEIARSRRFEDEAGARHWLPSAIASRKESHDAAASHLQKGHAEDDYLKCADYEGHGRLTTDQDFVAFEKDGEYYFALLGENDEVLLRSEGYKTEKARENGIASVNRNKGDKERYKTEEHLGYHFVILTAPNHKEIARSCPKSETAATALIALLTLPPVAAPSVKAAAAAPITAVPEAASSESGIKWWWWVLLILALIVLFLLWRGCNEGEGTAMQPENTASTAPAVPVYAADHDCAWQPILFSVESDSISDEARDEISGVVSELQSDPTYRALFIGFSDSTGSTEYNIQLSQQRADAAKAAAVSMGVDASRISTSEEDEHNPVASNRTEAGRMYNRRVVMYVFNSDNHLVCRQQELEVPDEVRE